MYGIIIMYDIVHWWINPPLDVYHSYIIIILFQPKRSATPKQY